MFPTIHKITVYITPHPAPKKRPFPEKCLPAENPAKIVPIAVTIFARTKIPVFDIELNVASMVAKNKSAKDIMYESATVLSIKSAPDEKLSPPGEV